MKPARACPICTNCGSKKFERVDSDSVMVRCIKCNRKIKI